MVVVNYNDERKALTAAQLKEKLEFMDRAAIAVLPLLDHCDLDSVIADDAYCMAEALWARRSLVKADGKE